MLEPQSRTLLLDALKPPLEHQLDFAIGTTFSLDLVAMLAAPLAFAVLDRSRPDGKLSGDPIALLEALRRNADRFAVFCQAGRIVVPKPDRLLLSYLERNVVEVTAPQGGVFHPKVWVLRFVAAGGPVLYRFVCGSRNLTFDRSWDTALILEGELVERQNAFAVNHPLADFIAAMPGLALHPTSDALRQRVEQFQFELRRVQFELPEGFEEYRLWPIGIERYRSFPFKQRIDRLLVVSPFVSADGLSALMDVSENGVQLVSRLEELQKLPPAALEGISQVSVFSDDQPEEETAVEEESKQEPNEALADEAEPELSGLHAKLYVADAGWDARLWTGSANATEAAFQRNVEFLVELKGKKSICGIDAFLASSTGETGFASFLKDFVPADEVDAADAAQRKLEVEIDAARLALSKAGLKVRVAQSTGTEAWRMALQLTASAALQVHGGIQIRAWPISCKQEATARTVDLGAPGGDIAEFAPLTFEALTSFVAFDLSIARAGVAARVQFVLNLPVEGFPDDRAKRLLVQFLDNREAIVRYIQLLLDMGTPGADGPPEPFHMFGGSGGQQGRGALGEPLLEPLIRTLFREPARLDDVARLVEDLRQAGAGTGQLPEGFEEIWAPIWAARQRLNGEKRSS